MAEEVVMPRLSDTMEEGTIARWLKHEGDKVSEGDVLAEIETDKALMELSAYSDGVLLRIIVGDGESAPLGAPIAVLGEEGEDASSFGSGNGAAASAPAAEAAEREPAAEQPGKAAAEPARTAQPAVGGGELKASPIARRMAAEAGLDLRPYAGRGSGPEGRIVKVDVERLLADGGAPAPSAPPVPGAAPAMVDNEVVRKRYPDSEPMTPSAMLRTVARRMAEAKATVPHFYVESEIDMQRAMALRSELNAALADSGEKVSVNDLVLRASALALIDNPQFNRSWIDGTLLVHRHVNLGIAVALDDGLIVPVIREADGKSLRQIAREARDLAVRARDGKLRQQEIEGGTFTVSNLGMFDVSGFQAIINPPESGILAVGSIVRRPWVVGDAVEVRPIMSVTLSVDHRASSGAEGARLLQSIKRYLEGGLLLLS